MYQLTLDSPPPLQPDAQGRYPVPGDHQPVVLLTRYALPGPIYTVEWKTNLFDAG